jgi:hypothetical protein
MIARHRRGANVYPPNLKHQAIDARRYFHCPSPEYASMPNTTTPESNAFRREGGA